MENIVHNYIKFVFQWQLQTARTNIINIAQLFIYACSIRFDNGATEGYFIYWKFCAPVQLTAMCKNWS